MKIELYGLELHGHHGVLAEEKEHGQSFWYDVELEVGDWGASDKIEDAVDYRDVVALVREVNDERFDLLEGLVTALTDRLHERFPVAHVKVRVRKRPAGLGVEYSAVTAEKP
ncbi:MAG: dihydroneopterin aldolase [Actinobacteria bacterium]|nr:dihydroneopterin aldolase [Actinomycetota bacterium]